MNESKNNNAEHKAQPVSVQLVKVHAMVVRDT